MNDRIRFGFLPLVARALLSLEFLIAVNGTITGWSGQASVHGGHGMRFIPPLLGAALAIELLGSICLITGFAARAAAATMCVYLLIVSVDLHNFGRRLERPPG